MPGYEADATTDTEKDKDLIAIDVKSILLLRFLFTPKCAIRNGEMDYLPIKARHLREMLTT